MLRLEKGHAIVAQDTDNLTNPFEAGLGWAVRMGKPFFVGQRSLRIHVRRGARQKLVGFELRRTQTERRSIGEANLLIQQRQHRRACHQHRAFADAGPHHRAWPWRRRLERAGLETGDSRQRRTPGWRARGAHALRGGRMSAPDRTWLAKALPQRRVGVKGPRAAEALKQLGLGGARPGLTVWAPMRTQDRDDSWNVVGRLGFTEFFVEERGEAAGVAALEHTHRRKFRRRLSGPA